ncbi:MAG: putative hemolysin [Verrucomicrobiales bacterium]
MAISAIVSGIETALFAIQPHHESGLAGRDRGLRAKLRLLFRRSESSRVTILLLGASLNLGVIILGLYGIREANWFPYPHAAVIGLLFAIILVGDVVPKFFALAQPALFLSWFSTPFLVVSKLLGPLSRSALKLTKRLEGIFVSRSKKTGEKASEDEFDALVELHREEGSLEAGESEIISEIVKLGNKTAKDCMTPRRDAFALPGELSREQLLAEIANTDAWKIPIYSQSLDTITGTLDVRRFLQQNELEPIENAIDPPVFVPETMMALTAFRDYLSEPHSLVIVLDEYGGTEGILTHAEVIEEIIGEATPETAQEDLEFQFLAYDRVLAKGSARLDELGEALGVDLEHEGLDTIGGLVFNELGHLPKRNEVISLGQVRAKVLRIGSRRVEELYVERVREVPPK